MEGDRACHVFVRGGAETLKFGILVPLTLKERALPTISNQISLNLILIF